MLRDDANATYENIIDEEYEPIETPTSSPADAKDRYENIHQPQTSYENIHQPQTSYENVDQPQTSYENVDDEPVDDTGDVAGVYENLNVYEDVVPPPPPNSSETEEIVYHQVKFFRKSIQEVNELVKESEPEAEAEAEAEATERKQESQKTSAMSVSLPSLCSAVVKAQSSATTSKLQHPATAHHAEENDSVTSKRRLESEIGRDLLRERRTRNEIQNSRRSESNLSVQHIQQHPAESATRHQSTSESSSLKQIRPPLPVKSTAAKKSSSPASPARPTTLETSFDCDTSSTSPLSPSSVSVSLRLGCQRQTSVKELLNKFQPTEAASASLAPTSPTKNGVEKLSDVDVKKKDTDKENIQLNVTRPPSSETSVAQPVRDLAKEELMDVAVIRQKSLNVGIDMSDPRTRLRIERYKEERRSFLREKYKSESFRSDGKSDDDILVRLKQKAVSPTRCVVAAQPTPPSVQQPQPGHVDEEVNVKERAAHWLHSSPTRSSAATVAGLPVASASAAKRIRDMAAMFEKESP